MIVSIVQADIIWENIAENLILFSDKITDCPKSDIIVLPEMFTSGFSLNVSLLSEKMDGRTIQWMKDQANKTNALIIGSIIIEEQSHFYNRCICAFPDGKIEYYDKNHLFSYGNEDQHFTCGTKYTIIEYKGWRIKPMICYDLRFPVAARNVENYDILIYVASWPDKRKNAWNNLLVARAIENQTYVIAANRVGKDGMNLFYSGNSSIIDFNGDILNQSQYDEILTAKLDRNLLMNYRDELPFLKDMDRFVIDNSQDS